MPAAAQDPPAPGPRAQRKVEIRERLVEAALEILAEEGVNGLTMRRLGERVGASTAGAYRHIDSKESVLNLCAFALIDQIPRPDVVGGRWAPALRAYAWSAWSTLSPHPWTLPFLITRDPGDPVNAVQFRWLAELFREAGFSDGAAALAIGFLFAFISGSLVAHGNLGRSPDPRPGLHRADDHFAFGLEGVLSAIERLA